MTPEPVEAPAGRRDAWVSGTEAMDSVYGQNFSDRMRKDGAKPFLIDTVEHLFAEIWARPGLSIRDRRLLVIGATAALGRADLIRIQVLGALRNNELDPGELQEVILQLAHYVGWGNATAVAEGIENALALHAEELTNQKAGDK